MPDTHEKYFCRCDACKEGYPLRLADRENDEVVVKRKKDGRVHEVRIPLDKCGDRRQ